jgi:uncharacterized RDD family membrane protein YckC
LLIGGAAAGAFFIVWLLSVLTMSATEERQRLGDLLAGTWVVRRAPNDPMTVPAGGSTASGWWPWAGG